MLEGRKLSSVVGSEQGRVKKRESATWSWL
jgi:hypothetical protein